MVVELVADVALICFCLAVIVSDWLHRRIYNWLTYPAMLLGLILSGFQAFPGEFGRAGLLDHLIATALVFAISYPLISIELQGRKLMMAGDAKFMMAIGALMGSTFLLWAFVWGTLVGGVAAIGFMVVAVARGGGLVKGLQGYMPYGVSLAAGTLVALFRGIPG